MTKDDRDFRQKQINRFDSIMRDASFDLNDLMELRKTIIRDIKKVRQRDNNDVLSQITQDRIIGFINGIFDEEKCAIVDQREKDTLSI